MKRLRVVENHPWLPSHDISATHNHDDHHHQQQRHQQQQLYQEEQQQQHQHPSSGFCGDFPPISMNDNTPQKLQATSEARHPPQQSTGQDTGAEGWTTTPGRTTTTGGATATKVHGSSGHHGGDDDDDLDYNDVNHFLGALHLERRQREMQQHSTPQQQQQEQPSFQSAASQMLLSPPNRKHNALIHLHTSSKLG
jgi:hypothetical protein